MKTKQIIIATLMLLVFISCKQSSTLKTPTLLGGKPLAAQYGSPDGYTLGKDGNIYLSMNQKALNWSSPAKIMYITPEDELVEFYELPVNTKTGKCSPLGLAFDNSGNLYVSDNQSFCTDEPFQAAIIKINIENGEPKSSKLAVTGFNMSNGMAIRGNQLFVAETNLATDDNFTSGIYRFELDELNGEDTLKVTGIGDPHLILTFETKNPDHKVGANGVAFNSKGELFVNNFGDAQVMKYVLDDSGNVISSEVFCTLDGLLSADGLQIDSEDNLWVADFRGNAIGMVNPDTRKTTIVAKNDVPSTGENGELDAPSECIRRGDKVYVSNIDIDYENQTPDNIQTISVIDLK